MTDDDLAFYCPRCFTRFDVESSNPEDWVCEDCGNLFDINTWMDKAGLARLKAEDDKRWSEAEQSGLIVPKPGGAVAGGSDV